MSGLLSPNSDERKNPLIGKMCLRDSRFHLIAHSQLQYDNASVEEFSGHMLCFTFVKMTVFYGYDDECFSWTWSGSQVQSLVTSSHQSGAELTVKCATAWNKTLRYPITDSYNLRV